MSSTNRQLQPPTNPVPRSAKYCYPHATAKVRKETGAGQASKIMRRQP